MSELAAVPALGPLFARAVLARRHGSGEPSGDELSVRDQPVDADRLARYQRLCGFAVSEVLPPTYLHLMSFPLAVARMVRPDFPFPLLGLVHLGNRIEQLRPVSQAEPVSLSVRAAGLREHLAGRLIDLVSEARIGAEPVWREVSSYLHRERATERTPRDPAAPAGPAGPVIRWPASADIGRRYAAVSGDRNPIHLHSLSARLFGFRSAIAHGMWLKARTLAAFEGRLGPAFDVEVAFKTPVLLPAVLELSATPAGGGWDLDVHDARSGKPHLTGSISPR